MNGAISNKGLAYIAAIVVVAVVAAAFIIGKTAPQNSNTGNTGGGTLYVQLTDPPVVPTGTQALLITYDNVSLHQVGAQANNFISFQQNGTVNLLNLTNFTQTIAAVNTSRNASFDMVKLGIRSAAIVIDNVTYNVTVPGDSITAKLNAYANINSSSGVLVDLSPTVVEIYNASNQSVFVMVPSVKAIVIGKTAISVNGQHVGHAVRLNQTIKADIEDANPANISITSGALSEAGNVTTIRLIVTNNGNTNVTLNEVSLYGYMEDVPSYWRWYPPVASAAANGSVTISTPAQVEPSAEAYRGGLGANISVASTATLGLGSRNTSSISVSASGGFQAAVHDSGFAGAFTGGSGKISGNAGASVPISAFVGLGEMNIFEKDFHNMISFTVEQNGSLELPYYTPIERYCGPISSIGASSATGVNATAGNGTVVGYSAVATEIGACHRWPQGYVLAPHSSVALNFSGVIRLGMPTPVAPYAAAVRTDNLTAAGVEIQAPLPMVGSSIIVLIPNQTYRARVSGSGDALAKANITATGYLNSRQFSVIDVTGANVSYHDTTSGAAFSETQPGFLAHTNSTVEYYLPIAAGEVVMQSGDAAEAAGAIPAQPQSITVTGITIDTPGFTLLSVSPQLPANFSGYGTPLCPVCKPGVACPQYCAIRSRYLMLTIGTPSGNYTGRLAISETFSTSGGNSTAAAGNGTLTGIVSIGPFCPVESSARICATNSTVYTSREVLLTDVATGASYALNISASGGFSGQLPTGVYSLTISNCTYLGCGYVLPKTIAIRAGVTETENIGINTGIE